MKQSDPAFPNLSGQEYVTKWDNSPLVKIVGEGGLTKYEKFLLHAMVANRMSKPKDTPDEITKAAIADTDAMFKAKGA